MQAFQRHAALAAAALLSSLIAAAGLARATTVSMLWTGASSAGPVAGVGTSDVFVSGTEPATLTLDVIFDIDANGLAAVGLDLEFDVGPDFDDELNIIGWEEWLVFSRPKLCPLPPGGGCWDISIAQESSGLQEGQLFGFEGFTTGSGPANTTVVFARTIFETNPLALQSDGDDVFATNERDPFATSAWDNAYSQIPFTLPRASVNLIPEPATAGLLSLGIAALAAASRARGRGRAGAA